MKLFSKAVLVSAMAISANAMALQSMDDESLSAATGQDGITVTIDTTGISIGALYLHDNDGLDSTLTLGGVSLGGTGTPGVTESSGAITINDLTITKAASAGSAPLVVAEIDADAGASGTAPFLNIGVSLGATDIEIGSIGVASSNAAPTITSATTARRGITNEQTIISDIGMSLGATKLNIQLGNQPQGALIVADANIIGGINITGLTLTDNVGLGDIVVGNTWIKDAGVADLGASARISVEPTGLKLTTAGTAKDIYVESLSLGTAQSIGSIEINGLDLNTTTMTVRGH